MYDGSVEHAESRREIPRELRAGWEAIRENRRCDPQARCPACEIPASSSPTVRRDFPACRRCPLKSSAEFYPEKRAGLLLYSATPDPESRQRPTRPAEWESE